MIAEVIEAEKRTDIQGMWVFIASEILLFSALFLCLTVLHFQNPLQYREGIKHMSLGLGTLNTAILLTSSWTLVLAIESIQQKKKRFYLFSLTWLLGAIFIFIKSIEYYEHIRDGYFPAASSHFAPFFFLYFTATGLHALHVFIGLCLILWLMRRLKKTTQPYQYESLMENVGLYWHFVDVVWVFLYPVLYLIDRGAG